MVEEHQRRVALGWRRGVALAAPNAVVIASQFRVDRIFEAMILPATLILEMRAIQRRSARFVWTGTRLRSVGSGRLSKQGWGRSPILRYRELVPMRTSRGADGMRSGPQAW